MAIIDHFNLPVSNVDAAKKLYQPILATLGIDQVFIDDDAVGFGKTNWEFGLVPADGIIQKLHLAFEATSSEQVDNFHQTAIDLGMTSNGAPGLRPEYGANYYAAYFLDPDGHNIEAVYRNKI
ncbi:MAG: VOC family protein [Rhizobiaceae bacterium]|nr:VOC family protein [Rhizobiaceae bacterium]